MHYAYILGMLRYSPIVGWRLESIGIYSELYPSTMRDTAFIPMHPDFESSGRSFADALRKARPQYNYLKSIFRDVKFIHG